MKYLDKLECPEDLKKMNLAELNVLSKEIRRFLVKSISKTGGHLASNLGVIELTIAMHYVFNSPKDKFIFDVGHQAYVHKIITGRKNEFGTLRKFEGLSGFPKTSESIHDHFDVGHSTNSISVAVGMATANKLNNNNDKVIAIIGDGAMTGGMAFEAMNNAGRLKSNIIIILNDNQMSISENIGYLNKKVNNIRLSKNYNKVKMGIRHELDKMNKFGDSVSNKIENIRDKFKFAIIDGLVFEELGIKYIGAMDGHNIKELITVLNKVKEMSGPIIIHVKTVKGKGYKFAEENPAIYHGVGKFDIRKKISTKNSNDILSYSEVVGNTITEFAREDKNVVGITAAMSSGTGLSIMEREFPNRVFDVGIAEQHALTFASGLSKGGFIPFLCIYSTFLQRGYDQMIEDICLQNSHVIICIDRSGLVGADGETHQGIFDISFLSHIPNLIYMAPKNKNELINMMKFAKEIQRPVAIRYPRGEASNILSNYNKPLESYESEIIFDEGEYTIIGVGNMVETAFFIYQKLKINGINIKLINARFINPIDIKMLEAIKNSKSIFVIEDNLKTGGYGSKILNYLIIELKYKGDFLNFAFNDTFIEHGDINSLYKKHNMDKDSIYERIISSIEK